MFNIIYLTLINVCNKLNFNDVKLLLINEEENKNRHIFEEKVSTVCVDKIYSTTSIRTSKSSAQSEPMDITFTVKLMVNTII